MALVTMRVNGQARLGATIVSFPGSAALGDTAAYTGNIFIHNYGNVQFSDSLNLEYEINGIQYLSNNNGIGIYFADSTNIAPGDSIEKPIKIHFTPSIFQNVGTSGVVIWPRSLSSVTLLPPDTTTVFVTLSWPAGIDQPADRKLLVYMEGAQLNVKIDAENLLKRVRIYAIDGQITEERNITSSSVIDMENYPAGLYIAQIIFVDDSQKAFKIVNIVSH